MTYKPRIFRYCAALIIVSMLMASTRANVAQAAISQPQAWSTVYAGPTYPTPTTYSYTVNEADNRLLVVAVSSTTSASVTQTASVTYGGQSLTLQVGTPATTASYSHTYLFYLKDTPAVMNGGPEYLDVTLANGTSRYNYVYAAVYADVDQSANPITDSKNFNSASASAAVGPFAPLLAIGSGDQAVEIINLTGTALPNTRTITTWAANWAGVLGPNSATDGVRYYSAYAATNNTTGTTNSQHTANANCYRSMSAMSIKPFIAFSQQGWSTVYAGAAYPAGTYSYTVNDGNNRMLVVAVSSTTSAAVIQTASVTYGGQNLTRQVGTTTSSITHTYLFYLKDTPLVMDGTPQDLAISLAGSTSVYNYVYATVYADVDQSANPITNSQNYNSAAATSTTVGPLPVLSIAPGDQAVEIINLTRTATPASAITAWASYWSRATGPDSSGVFTSAYVATNNTPGAVASSHTAGTTCYRSISAMSIKPFTSQAQQGWSTVYAGVAFPQNNPPGTYSYTVAAGANRMLIVAVSSATNPASTQTVTVTYGVVGLTQRIGDGTTSSRAHTYLFYLLDTPSVMDGLSHNLTVTVTGGTTRYNYVYAAVYTDVDQSNPIADSKNRNRNATSATVGPFTTALAIGSGDFAVEIINLTATSSPYRTITTWASYWSPALGPNGATSSSWYYSAYAATDNTPISTLSQHTASGSCYSSISAMSINTINGLPTAVDDTPADVDENSGLTNIDVLANDSFGDDGPSFGAITITAGPGAAGTADVNKGGTPYDPTDDSIDFTPAALYTGPVSFVYRICDHNGDCDTATVSFDVVSLPLIGTMSSSYSAMLLNAPDFGLQAQILSGTVQGGSGDPYTVTLHVIDPDGGEDIFVLSNIVDSFLIDAGFTGDPSFGCDVRGRWRAWYYLEDSFGQHVDSNTTSWSVEFPSVHGIP